ncbi:MAG: helix-turn-helix transcriptional regulator [Anaerolineales bacterium]
MLKAQLIYDPLRPSEKRDFLGFAGGERANSSNVISKVVQRLSAPTRPAAYYNGLAAGQWDDPQKLSDQEIKAIKLLAAGATSEDVGRWMGCKTKDRAKNHGGGLLRLIRGKMGARNNVHLIKLAYRFRIIEPVEGNPRLAPWP